LRLLLQNVKGLTFLGTHGSTALTELRVGPVNLDVLLACHNDMTHIKPIMRKRCSQLRNFKKNVTSDIFCAALFVQMFLDIAWLYTIQLSTLS